MDIWLFRKCLFPKSPEDLSSEHTQAGISKATLQVREQPPPQIFYEVIISNW